MTTSTYATFVEGATVAELLQANAVLLSLMEYQEYLRSGCQEVWLLFPENAIVIIITAEKSLIFTKADTVSTQTILQGFSIPVAELFS